MSPGLSALGISALGLAVAASVSLTTAAEVPQSGAVLPMAAPTATLKPGPTPSASPTSKVAEAFNRPSPSETTQRNDALRKALVAERAAQRTEQLAKSAESAASLDRDAAKEARQRNLVEANEASRVVAAQLAAEAVRKTAEAAAAAAAAAASAPPTTTETTGVADPATTGLGAPNTTTIPTGTNGVAPVPGAVVGARWGQRGLWSSYHTGIDFRAGYGTPIRSVLPGVVIYAGNSRNWAGNHVAVQHADGTTTMYSHMSSMAVGVNQTVAAGAVIGYVGATGRAFGAHLHFELYPAGVKYGDVYRAIDPQPWLNAHNVTTR